MIKSLKSLAFLYLAFLCVEAQTYNIQTWDGSVINSCSGTFVDAGGDAANYAANEDYQVSFCSDNGEYLYFKFMDVNTSAYLELGAGDTLFVYDGIGTSGDLIDVLDASQNATSGDYTYTQNSNSEVVQPFYTSTCVTFVFKSDGSSESVGWIAEFECKAPIQGCNGNPAPSDVMRQAPMICNLDGFCGQTSVDYSSDLPYNMGDAGSCGGNNAFMGNVNNNSWIKFRADSTGVVLGFNVYDCTTTSRGVQTAILQPNDLGEMVRYSQCAMSESPGLQGAFDLIGTGMTAGEVYYVMIDGSNSNVCDYTISAKNGISLLSAGEDTIICNETFAELEAIGFPGDTYQWTSTDPNFGTQTGQSIIVTPDSDQTYTVELISGDCSGQTDMVNVVVETCTQGPPIDDTTVNNEDKGGITGSVDVKIPNVFTPNGDGQNDLFFIKAENVVELTAHVYNRWGNSIVTFDALTKGWNGKNANGVDLEDGVYFVVLEIKGADGSEIVKDSAVTLKR